MLLLIARYVWVWKGTVCLTVVIMFVESHMNLRSCHSIPSLMKDENAKLSIDVVVCLTCVRIEERSVCCR